MIDFFFAEGQARSEHPYALTLSSPDAERILRSATIPHRYLTARRILEVAFIITTSPLTLVLCMALALIVRMDSPGPVLFRQQRPGRDGAMFTMLKFRTMRHCTADADDAPFRLTCVSDNRITHVGRFMRRHRLDELPQLWNVLRGEMSVIGPRPEPAEMAERFEREIPLYRYRRLIRPGITGWGQIHIGYAGDVETTRVRVTDDLFYILNISAWIDIEIALKTIRIVLSGYGAR